VSESDVVEVRVAADSVAVAVGHELQLRAYPLDGSGALLVGMSVSWQSTDVQVASVDDGGLVTGVAEGDVSVIASIGSLSDTTFVTVAPPPVLALSKDSVGFDVMAGGADPAPDTIFVTNTGGLTLNGLSVDSILYEGNTSGWLSAQLSSPTAPATLELEAVPAGITAAGVYAAVLWLSATNAESSPAAVAATLEVAAGAPLSSGFQIVQGNGQTVTVGLTAPVAPTISLIDQFDNPVPGATVVFTASGGGAANPAMVVTDQNGQASTAWTVSASGHSVTSTGVFTNTLTASVTGLTPLQFTASARYSYATHVNPIFAASCNGCHGSGGNAGGQNFDGTPAQDYNVIVDVIPSCDATLGPAGYRRVSTAGGVSGADTYSILIRKLDNTIGGTGTCGNHGGGEVAPGTSFLEIFRAWIRNGAPNN
jgi:mono/diheme cytochrome c family protein